MNRRRGFAMIYALIILGLVALSLYALAAHFSFQFRRTRVAETDSQLHQFLLAGNDYVTAEASTWPRQIDVKTTSLSLPTAPVKPDAKVTIKLLKADNVSAMIEISAASTGRRAIEELSLKYNDGQWHVTGAELIGEGQ